MANLNLPYEVTDVFSMAAVGEPLPIDDDYLKELYKKAYQAYTSMSNVFDVWTPSSLRVGKISDSAYFVYDGTMMDVVMKYPFDFIELDPKDKESMGIFKSTVDLYHLREDEGIVYFKIGSPVPSATISKNFWGGLNEALKYAMKRIEDYFKLKLEPDQIYPENVKALMKYLEFEGFKHQRRGIRFTYYTDDLIIRINPFFVSVGVNINGQFKYIYATRIEKNGIANTDTIKALIEDVPLRWHFYLLSIVNYALYNSSGFIRPSTKLPVGIKNLIKKPDYVAYYYIEGNEKIMAELFRTAKEVSPRIFKVSTELLRKEIGKMSRKLLMVSSKGKRIRVEKGYIFHPFDEKIPYELRNLQLKVLRELAEIYGDKELVAKRFVEATEFTDIEPKKLAEKL